MALLPQDRQSQVMLLITMLMAGLGWAFWTYWEQPTGQQIEATRVEIDSLQRIIVPQDVILKPAAQQAQHFLADTLGALLEAQFAIRTFVKAAAPPPAPAGKKPAARPGEPGGGGRE